MYSEVLEENDCNLDLKSLEIFQQWCSFDFFFSLDYVGATIFPFWSLLVISRITHFQQLTWSLKQLRTEAAGGRGETELRASNLMADGPMSFSQISVIISAKTSLSPKEFPRASYLTPIMWVPRKKSYLKTFNLGHTSDSNQGDNLTRHPVTEWQHHEDFQAACAPWQCPSGHKVDALRVTKGERPVLVCRVDTMPHLSTWCMWPSKKEMESM